VAKKNKKPVYNPVSVLDVDLDHALLQQECVQLLERLGNPTQVCLQTATGEDDWLSGTGRCDTPKMYNIINPSLANSYIEQVLDLFPEYYRWRLLTLESRRIYSVHSDLRPHSTQNLRLHIPISTSPHAHMQFWEKYPHDGVHTVRVQHLAAGAVYTVDTSGLHTAVNTGHQPRIHLVGEHDLE